MEPFHQTQIIGAFAAAYCNVHYRNRTRVSEGTIRKEFALSIGENSVHGSDGAETAAEEIAFFFAGLEIVG